MKLGTKFSLSASILVTVVITGVSIFLFVAEKGLLMKEMKESQINTIKGLARVGKEFLITKNRIILLNYINQIKEVKALVYAELLGSTGEILAHTDLNLLGSIDNDVTGIKARTSNKLLTQSYFNEREGEIYDISLPIFINNEKTAYVRIGFSKLILDQSIKRSLKKTKNRIFGVAVVALILGIFGALALAQMMTKPIKKMAQGAALIGQGKLDTVIHVVTKDELGSLACDLNKMAEKLRELDEMKQDFVSSVTHELRSPLNSLGMYFDLFFKGSLGEISAEQNEALSFMKDSATRLSRFINDLLDVAKIERGKMEVIPELFDLNSVVSVAVQLYKIQADEKQIKLNAQVPQDLPFIFADPGRTSQVLNNLISNAVKFTPEGGSIKVECREEQKTGGRWRREGDKNFVEVSVKDTGMGIPKDQLHSIFDKFKQVKGAARNIKGQKGTGLGLSIVKSLVESQWGNIRVESKLGKGTVFYFTLPAKKR